MRRWCQLTSVKTEHIENGVKYLGWTYDDVHCGSPAKNAWLVDARPRDIAKFKMAAIPTSFVYSSGKKTNCGLIYVANAYTDIFLSYIVVHRRKTPDWSTRDPVTLPNSKWRARLPNLYIYIYIYIYIYKLEHELNERSLVSAVMFFSLWTGAILISKL